jgi:hypothetical protein
VTVTVSPNDGSCAPWKAATTADWISLKPASGTTSGTVRIDYTANSAATARSASVAFTRPDCTGPTCGMTANVNQSARATFTLSLTLQQGEHLSGPYSGTVTGPNGFSCAINWSQEMVACPPAAFPNGLTVQLMVTRTSCCDGDGEIFVNNTRGCDALKPASRGTATCAVNMTGDRSVVIGVGCMIDCVGYLDLAGDETSGHKPASTDPIGAGVETRNEILAVGRMQQARTAADVKR